MKLYDYLHLDKLDCAVAIIKNAKSNKMGKKDIIKIEGPITMNLDVLGVIDANLTVNIIENGRITSKRNLTLPEEVSGIIKCKNPRCITSTEPDIQHKFKLTDKEKVVYRCVYCEQTI